MRNAGEVRQLTFTADDGSGSYERVRRGSRAILIKDGKMLLAHELATGYYCIPGGGQEEGETDEETCVREIAEEVGILVRVGQEIAVVNSYWKDLIFENHFFLCSYEGETGLHQTEQEAENELIREWVSIAEAKAIFSDPKVQEKSLAWIGCYKRDNWIMDLILNMNVE